VLLPGANVERVLARVLELAGDQLGMDVAWVSEFAGGEQRVRVVHGDVDAFGIDISVPAPYEQTYCARVIDGRLPNVIPDTASDPRTRELPITHEQGIGAYAGAPLKLADGTVYGMLCCLSRDADSRLDERDGRFLGVLAQIAAEELDRERTRNGERAEREDRIAAAVRGEALSVVFQPIVDLRTMVTIGAEALSRFTLGPKSPAAWFEDAARVGRTEELELVAVAAALEQLDGIPAGVYLSVNVSPATLVSSAFAALITDDVASRLQVEITEQTRMDDGDEVAVAIDRLRAIGARVAIDDAGAGYAGLQQILRVRPDVIKLDIALTRNIDSDPARAALARALIDFAGHLGAELIAEGIETQAELDTLLELGIASGQGYLLGRPAPLPLAGIATIV
jgi:EAL domain-containing protein (putative c-di-GMP-specific phosphodiesterase class I)